MNKPIVEIQTNASQKLFSRNDILTRAGVYKYPDKKTRIRFVSNGQREIFILGDGCPIYKSDFAGNEMELVEAEEKIVFMPIK